MEKAKCPKCSAIIDHLKVEELGTDYVNEYVRRYGTSDLSGEDVDIDDTDCRESETADQNTDETNYYCPECDSSLIPEELEIIGEEGARYISPTKPNPSSENSEMIENDSFRCSKNLIFFVCAKCETKVEVLGSDNSGSLSSKSKHGEREVKCTKCNRRLTAKNAKQIIKV